MMTRNDKASIIWFVFTEKKPKINNCESIWQPCAVDEIIGMNEKKRRCQIENSHTWLIQAVYVGKNRKITKTYKYYNPLQSYFTQQAYFNITW